MSGSVLAAEGEGTGRVWGAAAVGAPGLNNRLFELCLIYGFLVARCHSSLERRLTQFTGSFSRSLAFALCRNLFSELALATFRENPHSTRARFMFHVFFFFLRRSSGVGPACIRSRALWGNDSGCE